MANKYVLHKLRKDRIYIPLEDVPDTEWFWTDREKNQFDILWHLDMPVKDLAEYFNKSETSVVLMAFDRLLRGVIKPREGWTIW